MKQSSGSLAETGREAEQGSPVTRRAWRSLESLPAEPRME